MDDLNAIVDVTLKSPTQFECPDNILTIKGHFVKSSDIQISKCQSSDYLQQICVFATHTFYVDTDLYLRLSDIELHILANKWHILGNSTFNLNGHDGSPLPPLESPATAGEPGNHGINAGNFFGIANEIVNGNHLTVQLKGGNGGNGQDGTGSPDVEATFRSERIQQVRTADDINKQSFKDRILEHIGQRSNGIVSFCNSDNNKRFDFGVSLEDARFNYEIMPTETCGPSGIGGSGKELNKIFFHLNSTKLNPNRQVALADMLAIINSSYYQPQMQRMIPTIYQKL